MWGDVGGWSHLRVENEGTLPALRLSLHLHRHAHGLRRRDIADLISHARDAPRSRCVVDGLDDGFIEAVAIDKGLVERELADLGAHRRLRELRDRKVRVLDAIRRHLCVRHLDE